jgi:hypothetical protein
MVNIDDLKFLERILVYLENHEDDGDYRETWKSDQLKQDINTLIDILGLPEERKQRVY